MPTIAFTSSSAGTPVHPASARAKSKEQNNERERVRRPIRWTMRPLSSSARLPRADMRMGPPPRYAGSRKPASKQQANDRYSFLRLRPKRPNASAAMPPAPTAPAERGAASPVVGRSEETSPGLAGASTITLARSQGSTPTTPWNRPTCGCRTPRQRLSQPAELSYWRSWRRPRNLPFHMGAANVQRLEANQQATRAGIDRAAVHKGERRPHPHARRSWRCAIQIADARRQGGRAHAQVPEHGIRSIDVRAHSAH